MPAPEHLPRKVILRRSLRHHCPRCDQPSVFKSAFRLYERCPHCGLPLEMEDGWSYAAVRGELRVREEGEKGDVH